MRVSACATGGNRTCRACEPVPNDQYLIFAVASLQLTAAAPTYKVARIVGSLAIASVHLDHRLYGLSNLNASDIDALANKMLGRGLRRAQYANRR